MVNESICVTSDQEKTKKRKRTNSSKYNGNKKGKKNSKVRSDGKSDVTANAKYINTRKSRLHTLVTRRELELPSLELSTYEEYIQIFTNNGGQPPNEFADLPLSDPTLEALKVNNFIGMTPIQYRSLPFSLAGRDVLGEAETGSGKTLAFLLPMIERLHLEGWSMLDGIGGLVLAPTRELAIQIFVVLSGLLSCTDSRKEFTGTGSSSRGKIRHSNLIPGILVGGRDFKKEDGVFDAANVLVCTPGRLIQHMEEGSRVSSGDLSRVQVMVIDEADRMVDMGFLGLVKKILCEVNINRQTLLFSATLLTAIPELCALFTNSDNRVLISTRGSSGGLVSNRLSDTLSLRSASVSRKGSEVSTEGKDLDITPDIKHFWEDVALHEKMGSFVSFLRTHQTSKMLVFVSTCKQVSYLGLALQRLRPMQKTLQLHSRLSLPSRLTTFSDFSNSVHACLIATDVACRGLDFPSVNWVVQFDSPDSWSTYIHRVGRTGRMRNQGSAITLGSPMERTSLVESSKGRCVVFTRKSHKEKSKVQSTETFPKKQISLIIKESTDTFSVGPKLSRILASDPFISQTAARSVEVYLSSLFINRTNVSEFKSLDLDRYCKSMGLPGITDGIRRKYSEIEQKLTDRKQEKNIPISKDKNINHKLHKLKEKIRLNKLKSKTDKGEMDGWEEMYEDLRDPKKIPKCETREERLRKLRKGPSSDKNLCGSEDRASHKDEEKLDGSNISLVNKGQSEDSDCDDRPFLTLVEEEREVETTKAEGLVDDKAKKGKLRLRKDGTFYLRGTGGVNLSHRIEFPDNDSE